MKIDITVVAEHEWRRGGGLARCGGGSGDHGVLGVNANRALALGSTLMAARIRQWCFPFLHDWSKWGLVVEGQLTDEGVTVGRYWIYRRECRRCGRAEVEIKKVLG